MTQAFFKTKTAAVITNALARIYEAFRYRVSLHERSLANKKLEHYFSDLTVQRGMMQGLRYPSFSSFGSSLFPKLAGIYELELEPAFKRFSVNKYHSILDIGCAEGYYAAGLAKLFPSTKVIAFDIDETARSMCGNMAALNKVEDRVEIQERCTPEWIAQFLPSIRALIVCDCEGYERHLFNGTNIHALKHCDLVIELHPMTEPDVKLFLHQLFQDSHHVSYVSSLDDQRKMADLPQEYADFSALEKLLLVQEGRPYTMDWLILTANDYSSS